jgi:adenylate cyclase, class 2
MSSHYQETEVKLYTPDLVAMQRRLESLGARLTSERVYERNVRYDTAEGTLIPAGLVIRLREDTRVRLTYKDPASYEHGVSSRTELEVEVSDFATMEGILGRLGYFPAMVYEKYRTTFKLMKTEVVLDEMPFGNFMEIEGDIDAIENVIDELRVGGQRRYVASYTRLFENVKHNLKLDFPDLTFNSFEGIHVPENAFWVSE